MAKSKARIKVEFSRTIKALQNKRKRVYKDMQGRAVVGYSAEYAIYVHEDLMANHPNGGQAKFLQIPLRQWRRKFASTIRAGIRAKKTMRQALLDYAYKVLEDSKKLVPVDTGYLRDSGFARVE